MGFNRKHLFLFLCIAIMLIALAACGSSTSHCFLCEGISHDKPCVVNLATGEIAELSVGGYGHVEHSITGGISVTGENGESCFALVPVIDVEMNPNLYCDDCLALIKAASNNGYVLADLGDLTNIKLYSLKDTTIRNYIISVSKTETVYEIQMMMN